MVDWKDTCSLRSLETAVKMYLSFGCVISLATAAWSSGSIPATFRNVANCTSLRNCCGNKYWYPQIAWTGMFSSKAAMCSSGYVVALPHVHLSKRLLDRFRFLHGANIGIEALQLAYFPKPVGYCRMRQITSNFDPKGMGPKPTTSYQLVQRINLIVHFYRETTKAHVRHG